MVCGVCPCFRIPHCPDPHNLSVVYARFQLGNYYHSCNSAFEWTVVGQVVTEEIAGWAELRQFVHKRVELDQPRRLRLVWIENQSPLEAAMAAIAATAATAAITAMAGLLALVAAVDY